jgi:hypothetical protein
VPERLTVGCVEGDKRASGVSVLHGEVDAKAAASFVRGSSLLVDALPLHEVHARVALHAAARDAGIPVVVAFSLGACGTSVTAFRGTGSPSLASAAGLRTVDGPKALVDSMARLLMVLCPDVDLDRLLDLSPDPAWLVEETMRIAEAVCSGDPRVLVPRAPDVLSLTASSGIARIVSGPTHALSRSIRLRSVRATLRRQLPVLDVASAPVPTDDIAFILDAARWSPSGDNRQRCRVSRSVPDSSTLASRVPRKLPQGATLLHLANSPDANAFSSERGCAVACVEFGAFLENARLAAAERGLTVAYVMGGEADKETGVEALLLILPADAPVPRTATVAPAPVVDGASVDAELYGQVRRRHTDRRSFRTKSLPPKVFEDLASLAAPLDVELGFHTTFSDRYAVARLNHRGHQTRMIITGGVEDVGSVMEWTPYPETGMPGEGLGMSRWQLPFVRSLFRNPNFWGSYFRHVPGANFAGTIDPALVPGIRAAAHVTFSLTPGASWRTAALVRGGIALQRIWLYLSSLGISMQPNMAPVIYTWAHTAQSDMAIDRHGERSVAAMAAKTRTVYGRVGTEEERVFFQTRVGYPLSPCSSRSLRLAPQDLSDPPPLK